MFIDDSPIELADEIEHGKALILEKLDALNDLRRKLRLEYVPLTVCTHLEQCIKETEVCSFYSLFLNDFLIYTKKEMSHVLFYDKIWLLPRALGLCYHIYLLCNQMTSYQYKLSKNLVQLITEVQLDLPC